MTSKEEKFFKLRRSGWKGPIDSNGNAVMSRTDRTGKPVELFKGGTGHGTPDDKKRGKKK